MIHWHKEGGILGLGLNIGWINGLCLYWHWIYTKKDTSIQIRFRIRNSPFAFIYSKEKRNFTDDVISGYLFSSGLMLITRELGQDLNIKEESYRAYSHRGK